MHECRNVENGANGLLAYSLQVFITKRTKLGNKDSEFVEMK
jgi:hypothetical protein